MPEPVVIVPHDPQWAAQFGELRDRLAAALGALALAIEHVGSTSVVGLAAKPIVDIDIVILSADDLPAVVERLAGIGYVHEGDGGIAGRESFAHPPGRPPHHCYVCARDGRELRRHLLFRDALRADPALVDAYAELKRDLADRFRTDRAGYSAAKTTFIERVLATRE